MRIVLSEQQYQKMVTLYGEPTQTALSEQYGRGGFTLGSVRYNSLDSRLKDNARTVKTDKGYIEGIKLAGNTFLVRLNHYTIAILFHNTYIVKVDINDNITINTNGWSSSPITRSRLDDCLRSKGINFWVKNHVVYMNVRNKETYVYEDGIMVLANGDVILPD
jgi:hypothetical protein